MVSRWGLCVCPSARLSCRMPIRPYFRFRKITWVNVNGFSPNLAFALILKISGLGLLMSKFHQFFTVICEDTIMAGYYRSRFYCFVLLLLLFFLVFFFFFFFLLLFLNCLFFVVVVFFFFFFFSFLCFCVMFFVFGFFLCFFFLFFFFVVFFLGIYSPFWKKTYSKRESRPFQEEGKNTKTF